MQIFTASQTSLATPTKPVETYTTLWSADGTYLYTSSTTPVYVQDGLGGTVSSASQLLTINSKANPSTKYALEATIYVNSSSYAITVGLYDVTASAFVGSSIQTTSTTATVVRSTQYTLTPGHAYGIWFSVNGGTGYFIDASLITFP